MSWTKDSLRDTIHQRLGDGLFLVVSNREPYVHRFEGEDIICQMPASGLVVALDPVMRTCGGTWVAHGSGEADRQVVDGRDRLQVPPESPSYMLRRVWLSKQEEDGYYYGFANEALWPLCHIAYTRPSFNAAEWDMYRAVNQKFAEAILEEVGDRNAFVFIQDYHLALLSRLIKRPNIRTAQFWHIPWPNREAFRICPWAEELLDGLLGNDLLGFHIQYHCQNFLSTVDRLIESRVDYDRSEITRGGLTTKVRPFPISVDFDALAARALSPEVAAQMATLRRRYAIRDQVVMLGVDRLDYTKGIPERLRAVDRFLERYPDFHRRFLFVEIGVPSRVHIETYQRVNEEIDDLVEAINWKYQTETWKPIIYLKQQVEPITLWAWYRLAHLCAVTSLHDGMNLVAKEFVTSRANEDGVLLLSRFTGAAWELTDAELVNPFAVDELAEAIHRAIRMPLEEQQRRMRKLRAQVNEHNIYEWAGSILSSLFEFEFHEA